MGDIRQAYVRVSGSKYGITASGFQSNNLRLLQSKEFDNSLFGFTLVSRFTNSIYQDVYENDLAVISRTIKTELEN